MKDIICYTDGSYRQSKNSGGIGIIWIYKDKIVKEFSKRYENSTNNIMELMAIYIALKSIKKPINSFKIYSDSQYSIGVITNETWKPKKNVALINKIKEQLQVTQQLVTTPIEFLYVKGHNKDKFNERVDYLAQSISL